MAATSVDELAPDFDERAVVEAAKDGDHEALATLYEFYFPRVYRYVAARIPVSEDAEDVTEEVFVRILANLEKFAWRGLPFGAWVFRIARNEVVSHARKQKVRANTTPLDEAIPDAGQDHTARVESGMLLEAIRMAAAQLPEAQREVLSLRFGAGLSVAETAATLNKSENNVKVLQHKAVARLRKLVNRE